MQLLKRKAPSWGALMHNRSDRNVGRCIVLQPALKNPGVVQMSVSQTLLTELPGLEVRLTDLSPPTKCDHLRHVVAQKGEMVVGNEPSS
jgi:hypothetical protein